MSLSHGDRRPGRVRASRSVRGGSWGARTVRTLSAAVVVTGLTVALAGCGSSADSAGSSTAGRTSASPSGSPSGSPGTPRATGTPSATATGGGTATPSGGLSEVPSLPVTTAPAVPLSSPATVAGVTVSLGTIAAFTGTGVLPGEVAGPAVAVPVTLRNGTGAPVSADDVVVDLVGASGAPAAPLSSPPANPLTGTVAPGASVSGTYTFTVPTSERSNVSITVTYRAGVPVARFTGPVPS